MLLLIITTTTIIIIIIIIIIGSNSIPCQFCKFWVDKRCSSSILKQRVECKCLTCTNQETDTAVEHPDIEFNGHSLEIEKFYCIGGTIRASGDAIDWIKLRGLLPLLTTRGLPLGAKCRFLYSACESRLYDSIRKE